MSAAQAGSEDDLHVQIERYRYEIRELIATARLLSSQRDIRALLGVILEKSRQVTGADAGSVYVVDGEDGAPGGRKLHFMLSQNDSIAIDFKEHVLEVDSKSIVGNAVLDARPINIPDLYRLGEPEQNPWGFRHNKTFDEKTGYRARSMLTVPMLSAHSEVIGVIQLINKKRDPTRRLASPDDIEAEVVSFDARSEEFALALASQAGVSLENAFLYDEIKRLFEGFVDASVMAIEARDPTTSGHSRRVAILTVALAERVDALADGVYRDVHFTRDELRQIEYAGVLHDFGKVGVRENVLVKAKKLYDGDRQAIELRFGFIRRSLQLQHAERKLRLALDGVPAPEAATRFAEMDADLARSLAELDESWALVLRANEPSVLDDGGFEKLAMLAGLRYQDAAGQERPYLEPGEIAALQVRRGSLTDVERQEIESHVAHTFKFLETIPWGRALRRIPEIASAHHEYLNGNGYPRRLKGGEIPLESRMMTISDIFDALTASDRPYKRAVPTDKALDIIAAEVKSGKCDGDLFKLFVDAQIYRRTL